RLLDRLADALRTRGSVAALRQAHVDGARRHLRFPKVRRPQELGAPEGAASRTISRGGTTWRPPRRPRPVPPSPRPLKQSSVAPGAPRPPPSAACRTASPATCPDRAQACFWLPRLPNRPLFDNLSKLKPTCAQSGLAPPTGWRRATLPRSA